MPRRFTSLALGGATLVALALSASPASAQILYDTTSYTGGPPGSTAAAIAAFDALAASSSGYGCKGVTTLNGDNNQDQFAGGSNSNIAYHESVVFTVPAAEVGTWSFRWGVDFGWGGTLLLDGVELQSRWTDMWWNGGYTDPTQYLAGSANLTAGTHILEVFGFENCCDGTGDAQFMPPGGAWQDINTTNLSIAPNVCGTPGLLVTASAAPSPVLDGGQITYTFFYESTGSASAPGASMTTAIPANTAFVSASSSGVYDGTAGTVTWSLGALGVGVSGSVTLTVSVNTPLADGTQITDTVSLGATGASTASATTAVTVSNALLTLGSTIAPNPVAAGTPLTVTLSYMNTGTGPATNAAIVDVLPANTTFVSADSGGTYDSGMNRVTFTLGTLAMGASGSVSYVAQVATPLANGTVLGDMASLAATNNATVTASGSTTVSSAPTLTLTDVPLSNPTAAGAMLQYQLSYGNTGSDAAAGATLAWSVPANVTFLQASNSGAYDSASNQVVWNIGAIAAGGSGSVVVDLLVASPLPNGTTLTDAASLTASNGSTVMANTTVTVTSAPVLTLTETGAPNPVAAGAQLTYTLAYGNVGSDSAAAAAIAAGVPTNTSFVSATGGGTFDSGSGQVTFPIGSLSAGTTNTVSFTVAVAAPLANGTVLSASASLSATGTSSAPAMAMTTVDSAPTLSLTNTGAPNPVLAGTQLTYTLAFANNGTDVAHSAALSDPLPAGLSFVSASNGGSYDSGTATVSWSLGDIGAGSSGSVTLVVLVSGTAAAGVLSDTATLSASNGSAPIGATAMTMVTSATPDAGADAGGPAGATGTGGAAGATGTGATSGSGGSGGSGATTGAAGAKGTGGSGNTTGTGGAGGTGASGGAAGKIGAGGSGATTGGAGSTGTAGSGIATGTGGAGGTGATGTGGAAGATGAAGTKGTGGTTGAAGSKGTAGQAGEIGGSTGGTASASEPSSGCGCAVATSPSAAGWLGLLTIAGILLTSRRRKPRR